MKTKKSNRFSSCLNVLFWFIIMILPILAWLFNAIGGITQTESFIEYINGFGSWTFIKNLIDNVFSTLFDGNLALSGYISYVVSVEIIHVIFDVIVFVPRLCHKWVEVFVER